MLFRQVSRPYTRMHIRACSKTVTPYTIIQQSRYTTKIPISIQGVKNELKKLTSYFDVGSLWVELPVTGS